MLKIEITSPLVNIKFVDTDQTYDESERVQLLEDMTKTAVDIIINTVKIKNISSINLSKEETLVEEIINK